MFYWLLFDTHVASAYFIWFWCVSLGAHGFESSANAGYAVGLWELVWTTLQPKNIYNLRLSLTNYIL